jgi:GNAT superfamily N-acetyltransferase
MPVFVTRPMAVRFEAVGAELARRCAREHLVAAGGIAAFAGVGSPLTHAAGLGMSGPVSAAELDAVEAWYRARESATTIEVCPLADPAFLCELGRRGYLITETSNLLVRRIWPGEEIPAHAAEVREESDAASWSRLLARGFFEHDPLPGELDIGHGLFHAEGVRAFVALVEGEPASGGAIAIADHIACLCADATLPAFRGRGAQLSLIRARLAEAVRTGCEYAIAETAPATISQRNYQRCAFEPAWTRLTFTRD